MGFNDLGRLLVLRQPAHQVVGDFNNQKQSKSLRPGWSRVARFKGKLHAAEGASSMKRFQVRARWMLAIVAMVVSAGCSTQPTYDFTRAQRPSLVLVYDFRASPASPFEDQKLIAQGTKNFGSASMQARQAALGEIVRTEIRDKLITGINTMGMTAQAGDPAAPAPAGAVLIRGDFSTGSPDNWLVRNIILFSKDKSTVDTDVYVLGAVTQDNLRALLHVLTNAETKLMPAASKKGETSATLDTYRPQIDELVNQTANQALAGISTYFANQGWISRSQVVSPSFASR
jgi:hypothetical protein